MAVASRGAALSALQSLIDHDPVPAGTLLHRPYLPDGVEPEPDRVLLDPTTPIGGYGDEARYLLQGPDEPTRVAVAGPARAVLGGRGSITNPIVRAYLESSLDLTMQGGTTSGVVYPLAVCDLATRFRFRNVGGASAGAIAAALTAAAELGRSERVRHPEPPGGSIAPAPPVARPAAGSPASGAAATAAVVGSHDAPPLIRRGFVGLTDVIGWLTQTRAGDPEAEEFRLAQLFRAPLATRDVYRVVIAVMRQRAWSLPFILLSAFGWWTRIATGAIIAATILATGWVCERFRGRTFTPLGLAGWGALGYLSFLATAVGLVLVAQAIALIVREHRPPPTGPAWVRRLEMRSSRFSKPPTRAARLAVPGALLGVAGLAVAATEHAPYAAGWLVGLAGTLTLSALLVVAAFLRINRFGDVGYGLLAGVTPAQPRNLLDLLAGAPRNTVGPSVVAWLSGCLNALAGLPDDAVLRFGHLWTGLDYDAQRAAGTVDGLALEQDPDARLVNLELMTTDLSRRRPYRFPLPAVGLEDPERLWVCVDRFRDGRGSALFPDPVLAALETGPGRTVPDRAGVPRTLYPLPEPWDLPVVVAVRMSMALPGLFAAVPLYRIAPAPPTYDDFGRILSGGGLPDPTDQEPVASEVWFSDGGITSNFPVHFFDTPLPRWPTVSLNLGPHPQRAPQQDVSLPQDWDAPAAAPAPLARSGLALIAAVFSTAMNWRDSLQAGMPGYRNRIAQVRIRPNEGGANLFMPRELIASMALRGALAGARLRTRFAAAPQWNRFRWLRLRVAMGNVEELRATTSERRGFYADAFSGPGWLDKQERQFTEQPAGAPVPWYEPDDGFWPHAPRLLTSFAGGYRPDPGQPDVLTAGVPRPEPVLRQVPQE